MFTGIIERTAVIKTVSTHPGFKRLQLEVPWTDIRDGQSIAVNGVCLTIANIHSECVSFDVIPETLAKTNLGLLAAGDSVNLDTLD